MAEGWLGDLRRPDGPAVARRILLCLRYGIGDLVMELPVLRALRRASPRAHVTALGAPPAVELLDGDDRVDAVVGIDRWGLRHRWDAGDAAIRAAIDAWLDERGFELFLDVRMAAPAIGAAVWRRGIRSLEADETAEAAAVAAGAGGVAAIKAAVRIGWGLDVPAAARPWLPLSAADHAFADAILRGGEGTVGHAPDLAGSPVAISPVASSPLKRWPVGRFAAVANRIIEEHRRPVLLFVGPQTDAGDELIARIRQRAAVRRIGPLHLRRVAALLSRCAAFLGNDTGLMHVAAAVGTPTVAVFGPTSPRIYLPPSPDARSFDALHVPCPHRRTGSLHPPGCWAADRCLIGAESCINVVRTDAVTAALRDVLGGEASRHRNARAS